MADVSGTDDPVSVENLSAEFTTLRTNNENPAAILNEDHLNDPVEKTTVENANNSSFVGLDDNLNDPVFVEDDDPVYVDLQSERVVVDGNKDNAAVSPTEPPTQAPPPPNPIEEKTTLPPPPPTPLVSVVIAPEITHGNKTFSNGDTYVGGLQGEVRAGQGTLKYANGKLKYEGAWAKDLYHGQGVFMNEQGSKYEGVWRVGLKDGLFVCSLHTGESFVGMHVEDKRHGQGVHKYPSGKVKYDGEWVNNVPHGQGTKNFDDGTKYVGQFASGKAHGFGVMTGALVYTGMWLDDKRHGQGVQT